MKIDLYDSELCLANNAPLRLPPAVRITCTAGVVWLTVAGEAGDVFLLPGDSHELSGRGLALLEAIGSAQVRVEKLRQALPAFLHDGLRRLLRRAPDRRLLDRRPSLSLPACSPRANA